MNILQQLLSVFSSGPDPEFLAQQLRKPTGDFAEEIGNKMNEVNEPLYDLMLDVIAFEQNDWVLEIGFGNGQFFDKLFSAENSLLVTGLDHSKEMVEAAKKNNPKYIDSGKLDVEWGSSNKLPFADNSFDKVFCNMVIYFWDDPEPHLDEIYRVLKPSGRFLTGMRTQESMLGFPFVQYGFILYETDEWEQLLKQYGFKLLGTRSRLDPSFEVKGDKMQLESCCVVAQKDGETII